MEAVWEAPESFILRREIQKQSLYFLQWLQTILRTAIQQHRIGEFGGVFDEFASGLFYFL
jgi:hypothetical protein